MAARRLIAAGLRRIAGVVDGRPSSVSGFMSQNPFYSAYEIGEWTYGYPTVYRWGKDATLRMGKYCSVASDVTIIVDGEHRIDWVSTYPFNVLWPEAKSYSGHPTTRGDVIIGNDVWIGHGATILSGVSLGDGCVVGACSLVTKSVPPYAIAAGNPARVIKHRFEPEVIERLEAIAWWNWDRADVVAALPMLLASDMSEFLDWCETRLPAVAASPRKS